MSMAVISIDTVSHQCTLTFDGVLVPADQIRFEYGTDYNGVPYKLFKYITTTTLPDGNSQDVEYEMVMPDPDEVQVSGMRSKEVKSKDRLYEEVEAFVNKETI